MGYNSESEKSKNNIKTALAFHIPFVLIIIFAFIIFINLNITFGNNQTLKTQIEKYNNSMQSNLNPYEDIIVSSDTVALDQGSKALYVPIKVLLNIISNLQYNPNVTKFTYLNDALNNDTSGAQQGISQDLDPKASKILQGISIDFSRQMNESHMTNYFDFSFLLTYKCYMYMLDPPGNQTSLSQTRYPNQPWCQELYFNKNNKDHSPFVTEPYYSTAKHHKIISVVMPLLASKQNQTVTGYIGAALDFEKFVTDFVSSHQTNNISPKLLLKVYNVNDNKTTTFDTTVLKVGSKRYDDGQSYSLWANSTLLNGDEERNFDKSVDTFDKSGNPNLVYLTAKNLAGYAITSTSNHFRSIDKNFDIKVPWNNVNENNENHGRQWELVLARQISGDGSIGSPLINSFQPIASTSSDFLSLSFTNGWILVISLICLAVFIAFWVHYLINKYNKNEFGFNSIIFKP